MSSQLGGVRYQSNPTHASQIIRPVRDGSAVGASYMNITDTPLKNKPPDIGGTKNQTSAAYREWRDEVAELLQARHHFDAAERWDYCDNSPRYIINRNWDNLPPKYEAAWVCSATSLHDAVLFSPSCDFPICPDCARRHTARLMNRYIPAIEKEMFLHPEYRLRTLTFTRSVQLGSVGFKEAAQDGFELIQKAMRQTVGKNWNKEGAGLLVNWEVGSIGLKLHYHAVYLGNWVDQKRLSEVWKELTDGDFRVWVSAVKHNDGDWQGAVSETLKYATKFYTQDKATGERIYLSPELTVQLFEAMKGTRRIRSYGSFYAIDPPPERVFCCEQCGSKMLRIGIEYFEIWKETGFTPVAWREMIRESLLLLRTANKSPPQKAKTDKAKPKPDIMLPGFDKIREVGTVHYDHE